MARRRWKVISSEPGEPGDLSRTRVTKADVRKALEDELERQFERLKTEEQRRAFAERIVRARRRKQELDAIDERSSGAGVVVKDAYGNYRRLPGRSNGGAPIG